MKRFVIAVLLLLVMPSVLANHNRFHTDINGNYLPMYDHARTIIFNEAYPMEYGFDPSGTFYSARYCGRHFFGQSFFGIMDNGRCTSRYGRYGRFGLAEADATLLTTDAATADVTDVNIPMPVQPTEGLMGRGMSSYYPDVMPHQPGMSGKSGKMSRFYP